MAAQVWASKVMRRLVHGGHFGDEVGLDGRKACAAVLSPGGSAKGGGECREDRERGECAG